MKIGTLINQTEPCMSPKAPNRTPPAADSDIHQTAPGQARTRCADRRFETDGLVYTDTKMEGQVRIYTNQKE